MSRSDSSRGRIPLVDNYATNITHLLWADRWIEAAWTGSAWRFKNGRDASDWLLYG